MYDTTTLTDPELEQLRRAVAAEQQRRRTLAQVTTEENRLREAALGALARHDGDPWTQPSGALTAYPAGAQVTHDGLRWVSLVDGNVWAPGVSGWRETTDDDGPPAWRQPTGVHDAYQSGERVSYAGRVWTAVADNVVHQPGVYGWEGDPEPGPEQSDEPVQPEQPGEGTETPDVPADPGPPAWTSGQTYAAGDQVAYDGRTWTARQPHTALDGWTPAAVPALWEPT